MTEDGHLQHLKTVAVASCGDIRLFERRIADPNIAGAGDAQSGNPVSLLELMERAGKACFDEIRLRYGARPGTPLIICGPGGNGGDGYVIARHFLNTGRTPMVMCVGKPKPGSDAAIMREKFETLGGTVKPFDSVSENDPAPAFIVDAIFGAGLSRPFANENLVNFLECARHNRIPVFAVDVPSGLHGDTGRILGHCAGADATMSFFAKKPGHLLADGPKLCGHLKIDSLGCCHFPPGHKLQQVSGINFPDFFAPAGHKFDYGHVLVLSGPRGRTGAARLAGISALKMGAGLVTIGSPSDAMAENAAHLTAIQLRNVNEARDLEQLLKDKRYNTLILGPGLGTGEQTNKFAEIALRLGRKCVLDADALTAFEENPDHLFDLLHEDVVITPHGGEFRRLFPELISGEISKLQQTQRAAKCAGCTVLYKGADTIIAAPSGETRIVCEPSPALATAGSGDVLAGMIAGRLARSQTSSVLDMASQAAFLHQIAGAQIGAGLTTEDLPEILPSLIRHLI